MSFKYLEQSLCGLSFGSSIEIESCVSFKRIRVIISSELDPYWKETFVREISITLSDSSWLIICRSDNKLKNLLSTRSESLMMEMSVVAKGLKKLAVDS
ncbi:hypothetical protein OGATHE_003593 [Ogataea polymorpha]|uniref:Uncharacterized protein n=1 Tax=Ogataea polymorpha TaxID=460523 RepID=A0A9P8P2S1_9ASCO|nr:hypothetical protein OGATHE_003593 [Ogataea polymorpha]